MSKTSIVAGNPILLELKYHCHMLNFLRKELMVFHLHDKFIMESKVKFGIMFICNLFEYQFILF